MEKAKKYLAANPEAQEVYATTDGFLFTKKYDAVEHANSLSPDNPVVNTFGREEAEKDVELTPKQKAVAEYTELFGEAPNGKLSAVKIQELIDAKKAEGTA